MTRKHHDPAPWRGSSADETLIHAGNGALVCTVAWADSDGAQPRNLGNLKLIEAAPQLLRAAERGADRIQQLCDTVNHLSRNAGLDTKVRAEDFADELRAAAAAAQGIVTGDEALRRLVAADLTPFGLGLLLADALNAWRPQFERKETTLDDISGADFLEWFGGWRDRLAKCIGSNAERYRGQPEDRSHVERAAALMFQTIIAAETELEREGAPLRKRIGLALNCLREAAAIARADDIQPAAGGLAFCRRFLDLSTSHLTGATRDILDAGTIDNEDAPSLVLDDHGPVDQRYGWWVWVPTERVGWEHLPDDLRACFEFAQQVGCEWICFDRDAAEIAGLPSYTEEEEATATVG